MDGENSNPTLDSCPLHRILINTYKKEIELIIDKFNRLCDIWETSAKYNGGQPYVDFYSKFIGDIITEWKNIKNDSEIINYFTIKFSHKCVSNQSFIEKNIVDFNNEKDIIGVERTLQDFLKNVYYYSTMSKLEKLKTMYFILNANFIHFTNIFEIYTSIFIQPEVRFENDDKVAIIGFNVGISMDCESKNPN